MELRSRLLAEVEPRDSGPGVPGPSSLVTEGSGELVPVSVMSHSSIADVAGASPSHPDTAGLMGATLMAPIVSSPQMFGSIGAALNPDVAYLRMLKVKPIWSSVGGGLRGSAHSASSPTISCRYSFRISGRF